jgi:hypothetical protein
LTFVIPDGFHAASAFRTRGPFFFDYFRVPANGISTTTPVLIAPSAGTRTRVPISKSGRLTYPIAIQAFDNTGETVELVIPPTSLP